MSSTSGNDGVPEALSPLMQLERQFFLATPKLDRYFDKCQYPTDIEFRELATELELTEPQIKFWFQKKREFVEDQKMLVSRRVLQDENERLVLQNFLMKEKLKRGPKYCPNCFELEKLHRFNALLRIQLWRMDNLIHYNPVRPIASEFLRNDQDSKL